MVDQYAMTRRGALVAGLSVATVGCDSGNSSSGGDFFDDIVETPAWIAGGVFLTLAPVAIPIAAAVAGRIGLAVLANFLRSRTVNFLVQNADTLHNIVEGIVEARQLIHAPPTNYSNPRPFLAEKSQYVNDFEFVPVMGLNSIIQIGIANNRNVQYGEYSILTCIMRVEDGPPQSYAQALGNGDLPHAYDTPALNGSYSGELPVTFRAPGAYVPYCWLAPRGQLPSDSQIRSEAFIGSPFIVTDDLEYNVDVENVLQPGTVVAKFHLPDYA